MNQRERYALSARLFGLLLLTCIAAASFSAIIQSQYVVNDIREEKKSPYRYNAINKEDCGENPSGHIETEKRQNDASENKSRLHEIAPRIETMLTLPQEP